MYSSSTWYKQAITAKFYVFFKLIKAYFYSIGPQTFKAGYYGKKKKKNEKNQTTIFSNMLHQHSVWNGYAAYLSSG